MAYALTTYVAPGPGNYSGTTTGYFLHDELSASYAFSSGVLPFVLPGWSSDPAKNPIPPVSEYEAAQSIPTPWGPCGPLTSGVVVGGNYGMVYRISITGASGKHLHVTHPSGAGSFVAQAPGGLWYSYTSFPQDFYVTSTTPWVFKFVQPGGNSSNFYFSIIS